MKFFIQIVRHRRDVSDESDDNTSFSCADKKDGFYSDLSNCRSYYQCTNGIASSGDCVGNYEWNSDLNKCDNPKNSDCTKRKQMLPNSTAIPPSNLTDHSKETTTIKEEVKNPITTENSIDLTTVESTTIKDDISE